ncbi:MAG: D-glycero-beta-D-manno-heptose 1-phosphate adenylyltransferase [Elusimicrobiota bacterium]|nr:D-glycero-beta-D-manno-heptose 1-phosphate adenylyltransferase [Endomicrobiia bacterium]MDW8165225.1 D-glycero-beta-D-manno-heptose 1-phosphate adenylyltransferase [Elusimicrobiota bacterium]
MIVSLKKLKKIVKNLKDKNKKIIFTNGCFDILHLGHVRLLKKAKSLGDILIVGLNTDSSIKKIKGPTRPINSQKDRAEVLDSIKYVDYVVLFNEETPYKLISEIKPHILVKGADYKLNDIVGRDIVSKVVRVKIVKNRSTTSIINKIKNL